MDKAKSDRMINGWLRMVVRNEKLIKERLAGDAKLITSLREAYTGAIRALVPRMAKESKQSEADIYRVNNGRIPMWAWPDPHRLEAGISTPIADGRTVDSATGRVDFTLNGIGIQILPDTVDPSLKPNTAETKGGFPNRFMPGAKQFTKGGISKITEIDPVPRQIITIQTAYGPGASATGSSKYGRGRTKEDLAGAKELPRSGTLGFHEGEHGRAMLEYVAAHPLLVFDGEVGMTLAQFDKAKLAFNGRLDAYQKAMLDYSKQVVDCVGTTTIDDAARSAAGPGAVISIVCTS